MKNDNSSKKIKAFQTIKYGGQSKEELIKELEENAIHLNEYARILFSSELFKISKEKKKATLIKLSVLELGFPKGATMVELQNRAEELGFTNCPMEIGPYLRLQYLDQPETKINELKTKNKSPTGAITIMSKPLVSDDDFPKGFYLIHVDGKIWLRAYCCSLDFYYNPSDEFIFRYSKSPDLE